MIGDILYVPSSYKKRPTLNIVEEVRRNEDFKTWNAQLALVIVQQRTELASYALHYHDLKWLAHSIGYVSYLVLANG